MPNPYYQPPRYPGPEFPFSRAFTSGPLGDLVAGIVGAPGDLQQVLQRATPQPPGIPSPGSMAPATLPTMDMINRAREDQNAEPRSLSYQSLYGMLPELSMLLRGAPTAAQVPAWLTNIIGGQQQPTPTQNQPTEPQQGWSLTNYLRDAFGTKPAY